MSLILHGYTNMSKYGVKQSFYSLTRHSIKQFNFSAIRPKYVRCLSRRSTLLKFDPTDEDGDFTSFGMLPFIQHRINQLLLQEGLVSSVLLENAKPTDDQRKLLAILQSKYSTILNGTIGSGKSLSLAMYALNLTLSRVPKYGTLTKRSSVDSVILVPTDELVDRYRAYFSNITEGLPEDSCPDKLILDKESMKYTLTRKPLLVEFLYSKKPNATITSGNNESTNTVPQILITTLAGLEKVVNDNENQFTQLKHLVDLQLVAVDEYNHFLKSCHINEDKIIEQTGTKSKYSNKMEILIKHIQNLHLTTFNRDLNYRLKRTSDRFKLERTGEHSDAELERRLTKQKRQVLYKPIQFCFIGSPEPAYKQLMNTKLNLDKSNSISHAIQNHSQNTPISDSDLDNKVHDLYAKYLVEKSSQISERDADPLKRYIEKVIRLNDKQREIEERERNLVVASSGPFNYSLGKHPEVKTIDGPINAYFAIGATGKGSALEIKNLDVEMNFPTDQKLIELMDEHVELSKNNVKNLEKSYLKYKMMLNQNIDEIGNVRKYIPNLIKQFKKINPTNKNPFLIVVPSYINVTKICKKMNGTIKDENFRTSKDYTSLNDTKEPIGHLLIHPSQLIGNEFKNYPNVIVFGIDSLLPQMAFTSKVQSTKKKSHTNQPDISIDIEASDRSNQVSGIIDPINDLSSFYLDKLANIPGNAYGKHIIFVMDTYSSHISKESRNMFEQDLKRFSQIVMYNGLKNKVTTAKLHDEQEILEYGIDSKFLNVINSKISTKK